MRYWKSHSSQVRKLILWTFDGVVQVIKVVSILSKFIFLNLKMCFFEKTGLQRNIVYRVHIGDMAQYRVHIARNLKKNIAQA